MHYYYRTFLSWLKNCNSILYKINETKTSKLWPRFILRTISLEHLFRLSCFITNDLFLIYHLDAVNVCSIILSNFIIKAYYYIIRLFTKSSLYVYRPMSCDVIYCDLSRHVFFLNDANVPPSSSRFYVFQSRVLFCKVYVSMQSIKWQQICMYRVIVVPRDVG